LVVDQGKPGSAEVIRLIGRIRQSSSLLCGVYQSAQFEDIAENYNLDRMTLRYLKLSYDAELERLGDAYDYLLGALDQFNITPEAIKPKMETYPSKIYRRKQQSIALRKSKMRGES
jgi:hypothetical protein